jgi:hypothetical protein
MYSNHKPPPELSQHEILKFGTWWVDYACSWLGCGFDDPAAWAKSAKRFGLTIEDMPSHACRRVYHFLSVCSGYRLGGVGRDQLVSLARQCLPELDRDDFDGIVWSFGCVPACNIDVFARQVREYSARYQLTKMNWLNDPAPIGDIVRRVLEKVCAC